MSDFVNFYNLSIADAQVDAVVAYLSQFPGVPKPVRAEDIMFGGPGVTVKYESFTFTFPNDKVLVESIALVIASPNALLNSMARDGLIHLDGPLNNNNPIPGVNIPPPVPPAVVLPSHIESPIGIQYTPLPSVVGSRSYCVPSDKSPNGTLFPPISDSAHNPNDPRYLKHVQITPFGDSVDWVRIS